MPRSQVRILRYQNWSIDIQTCEQIDYSSNLSDRSYCLWANRNFPLLVRREIRTHQLQSTSFPPPPSLSSFISPRSSLAALCVNFARSHPERDADTNMEKSLTFQLLVILKWAKGLRQGGECFTGIREITPLTSILFGAQFNGLFKFDRKNCEYCRYRSSSSLLIYFKVSRIQKKNTFRCSRRYLNVQYFCVFTVSCMHDNRAVAINFVVQKWYFQNYVLLK